MRPGRWTGRVGLAAIGFALVYAVARVEHTRPDPLRLALMVLMVVGVLGLVLDTSSDEAAFWEVPPSESVTPKGMDPRLASNVRLLEHHLTARSVDPVLRDHLGTLVDQALARRGLRRTDPRAAELLGPELTGVIDAQPRRLTTHEIDRCLERIETL